MKITKAERALMFTTAGRDCMKVRDRVRSPRLILISFTSRKNRATRNASPNPAWRKLGTAKSTKPATATKKSTLYCECKKKGSVLSLTVYRDVWTNSHQLR